MGCTELHILQSSSDFCYRSSSLPAAAIHKPYCSHTFVASEITAKSRLILYLANGVQLRWGSSLLDLGGRMLVPSLYWGSSFSNSLEWNHLMIWQYSSQTMNHFRVHMYYKILPNKKVTIAMWTKLENTMNKCEIPSDCFWIRRRGDFFSSFQQNKI